MSHITHPQANQHILLRRWFWWQCVRRSPRYRKEVSALLRICRSNNYQRKAESYGKLAITYDQMREVFFASGESAEQAESGFWLSEKRKTSKSKLTDDNLIDCCVYRSARELLLEATSGYRRQFRDSLPSELMRFQKRWRIKFPIPPVVSIPLSEFFQTDRVMIDFDESHQRLRLKVPILSPRNILKKRIEYALESFTDEPFTGRGRLEHYRYDEVSNELLVQFDLSSGSQAILPKALKVLGRVPLQLVRLEEPREYYERCLKVFDMRTRKNRPSWSTIAGDVYPKQNERVTRNSSYESAVAKVRQHCELIENSIQTIEASL